MTETTEDKLLLKLLLGTLIVSLALAAACSRNLLEPTVILISLDGFRWDYLDRRASPNLNQLEAALDKKAVSFQFFPPIWFNMALF